MDELEKYEHEHFAVKVEPSKYSEKTVVISVTNNGRQWTSIRCYLDQLDQVEKAIKHFRSKNKK